MLSRSATRKKLPLKLSRLAAAPQAKPGILSRSRVSSEREPPSAFGKLGTKAPLAVAAGRANANGAVGTRMGAALSSYGPLALKVCVALWIVAVLASVFVSIKG